jgi:hypothetical protein
MPESVLDNAAARAGRAASPAARSTRRRHAADLAHRGSVARALVALREQSSGASGRRGDSRRRGTPAP